MCFLKMFFLIWEIFQRPKHAFNQIRNNKPIRETVIVYISGIVIFCIAFFAQYVSDINSSLIFIQLQALKFTIDFAVLLLITFVANFFAVKLKGESNFLGLLLCHMFLAGIMGICIALIILIPDVLLLPSHKILPRAIVGLWSIILTYVIVHEIYNLSKIKTILISFVLITFTTINNLFLAKLF